MLIPVIAGLELDDYVSDQGLVRSALSMLDTAASLATSAGFLSEEERDRALLNCAIPYLKYWSEDGNATRPIAFLKKYLAGGGQVEEIDLYTLLAEDKGVRKSVHGQIRTFLGQLEHFRVTGIDTSSSGRLTHAKKLGVINDASAAVQKVREFRTEPLLLDVPQTVFQVKDWRNAIGSFELNWLPIDVRVDRNAVLARVWGSNVYRWHPEAPRQSQLIHRAAERLKAYGAKEFEMRFRPCLICISTGSVLRA